MDRLRLAGRVCTLSLVAAAFLVFGLPSSARAIDTCTQDLSTGLICLTVPNVDLATQGAGPYGKFQISGSAMSWSVLATGLNNFVFGDGGALGLNFNVTNTGTVTFNSAGSTSGFSSAGAGNEDGFGSFNFRVHDGAGFSSPRTAFTIAFTTANSLSLADLLTVTSKNAVGAAHMALATNTACTGFAGSTGANAQSGSSTNTACTAVPEPTTLLLVGSGLVGLGFFGRRRGNGHGSSA